MPDRAVYELIHEEAHVRAAASGTFADAGQGDIGRAAREVEATKGAGHDLKAGERRAHATIGRAVHAAFEFIGFADAVAAYRAYSAVGLAACAVFRSSTATVAAAHAGTAVTRTGEAVFNAGVAGPVAAGGTVTAIGRAGKAVFPIARPAEPIPAWIAAATVFRAAHTGLGCAAPTIATGIAETAVSRADTAIFTGGADLISTAFAEAAILGAGPAGFGGAALAVSAGVATAAIERTGKAILGITNSADTVTTWVAASAIVAATRAILIIIASSVTTA